MLHLLAEASSELPSRIGSSYHLSENPPPGLPSPTGSPHAEALVNGKKRKAADLDAASDAGGKKDKGKATPAKAVLSCQVSVRAGREPAGLPQESELTNIKLFSHTIRSVVDCE